MAGGLEEPRYDGGTVLTGILGVALLSPLFVGS